MARTVADAFNQYHQNYVKPQVESKLSTSAAAATYATQASLAVKADLDSPNFTGTPTAPTAGNDTDSTQIATTEFCQNLIRRLVGSAPETLNTLVELATAINNDPNFAETIVQALDGKLNKTDAANTYLAKTANAASASRDENGNVIHTTYATKSELGNVSVAQATSSTAGVMKLYDSWSTDAEDTKGTWTGHLLSRQFSDVAYLSDYGNAFSQQVEFKKGLKVTGDAISNQILMNNDNWPGGAAISKTINALRIYNGNGDGMSVDIKLNKENNRCEITASGGLYVNGTKVGS